MSKALYKVGSILKNSVGQFTKIVEVKDGRYGIGGWTTLQGARASEIANLFLNEFGIEACEVEVVEKGTSKSNDSDSNDNDEDNDKTPTKSSLGKLNAEATKALAVELGIEVTEEDTKATVLEKLYTHYNLV